MENRGYARAAIKERTIPYRPRFTEITGRVTASILLQQIVFHYDGRPFYKFRAPCTHNLYREGDSWTEELGFSGSEFDTAIKTIGTKIVAGSSKKEVLCGKDVSCLVIYWTDSGRVTWYELNEVLFDELTNPLYEKANSGKLNYLIQESGNTEFKKHDLPITESTETPRESAAPSAPIPSGDPVQHNLDEVIEYLEGTGHRKEELQAQCPYCQAPHAQDINTCPDCGVPVIWLNSTIWKRKFGKPAEYIRKLKGEDLKPVTPLQVEVAQVFGNRGEFQNVTQQRDVIRLEKKYPYGFITKMLYWANDKRAPFSSFVSACNNTDNLDSWKQEEGIQEKEVVIVETKSEPVDHQPEIPEFDDLDEWIEDMGRRI